MKACALSWLPNHLFLPSAPRIGSTVRLCESLAVVPIVERLVAAPSFSPDKTELFPTVLRLLRSGCPGAACEGSPIPETELTVPMIQSGFGDGLYPVYWAFDKDGQICQLIMEYIDCSEAYQ